MLWESPLYVLCLEVFFLDDISQFLECPYSTSSNIPYTCSELWSVHSLLETHMPWFLEESSSKSQCFQIVLSLRCYGLGGFLCQLHL